MEKSTVAVLKAASYEQELLALLEEGMREAWPGAAVAMLDKTVLLKPNLVEFDQKTCINTDPRLVLAVRELFLKLGAREVWIAEGIAAIPGTWPIRQATGRSCRISIRALSI